MPVVLKVSTATSNVDDELRFTYKVHALTVTVTVTVTVTETFNLSRQQQR